MGQMPANYDAWRLQTPEEYYGRENYGTCPECGEDTKNFNNGRPALCDYCATLCEHCDVSKHPIREAIQTAIIIKNRLEKGLGENETLIVTLIQDLKQALNET